SYLRWFANRWLCIIILFCWLLLLSVYVLCNVVIFKTKRTRKWNRGILIGIYMVGGTALAILLLFLLYSALLPTSTPDWGYTLYASDAAVIGTLQLVGILWAVFLMLMLFWYIDGAPWNWKWSSFFNYTPVSQPQKEIAPASTS